MPLVVEALRACTSRSIWFWGDQALIDIEARDSLLGRNLLGVYDRYGWHHLGPIWLLVLGVFRWLGGGSPGAVIVGSCVLQAAAAAAIVVVANRLRPGLTAWWAALVLLGYEWSFGLERLGTVWAPYAIALPTALLVLLIADVVVSPKPWGPTIAAVVCASFLVQTDVGTVVMVAVLALATPLLRLAAQARARSRANGGPAAGRPWPIEAGWGWSRGNWRRGAAGLAAVVVVLWLPPAIQQLSTTPGNLVQFYRFVSTHPAERSFQTSLEAAGTVFGSYPFRFGEHADKQDADPRWLVEGSIWQRPWYLVYILVTIAAGVLSLVRRQRQGLVLAVTSGIALLAAGWSYDLVYGQLFPYLVFWTGALVVPTWTACWLALAPTAPPAPGERALGLVRLVATPRWARLAVPLASLAAAATVSTSFAVDPSPLAGVTSALGRKSWQVVAAAVLAPRVRTIYIDVGNPDAMPEGAAIADQAMRHGRRVEVDRAALYFFDPSFAHTSKAQLNILVCCGERYPGEPPRGLWLSGKVGGQFIYTSAISGPSQFAEPPVRDAEMVGHLVDDSPGHEPGQLRLGAGQSADRPAENGDPVRHGPSVR